MATGLLGTVKPEDVQSSASNPAASNTYQPATPKAPQANLTAQQYTAQTQTLNNATDTVQGRLDAMLAADSPYLQRAKSMAQGQANQRGLLNSTMAAEAGTAAAMDYAGNVAKADTDILMNTRNMNQTAQNEASKFNADSANNINVANLNAQTSMYGTDVGAQSSRYAADLSAQTAKDTQATKFEQDKSLLGIENEYKIASDARALAAEKDKMTLGQTFDLEKMDKGVAGQLELKSVDQKNELAKMAVAQGYNLDTLSQQQLNALELQLANHEQTKNRMDQGARLELEKLDTLQQYNVTNAAIAFGYDIAKLDDQQIHELSTIDQRHLNDLDTLNKQFGFDIQKMDKGGQIELARMAKAQQYNVLNAATAFGYSLEMLDKQTTADLSKINQNHLNNLSAMEKQYGFDIEKMEKGSLLAIAQMDEQQVHDLEKMAKNQGYTLENIDANLAADFQKMDKAASHTLAQMEKAQQYNVTNAAKAFGYRLAEMKQDQINALAKMDKAQVLNLETLSKQNGFDLAKMDKGAAIAMAQLKEQQQGDLIKMATAQGYNIQNMTQQQINDIAKMEKGGLIQKELAKNSALVANVNSAMNTATNLQGFVLASKSAIMQDKDLSAEAKQAATSNIDNWAQNAETMRSAWYTTADDLISSIFGDAPAKSPGPGKNPGDPGFVGPVGPEKERATGVDKFPEDFGFKPPPKGSVTTQAMVPWINTKTGERVTAASGGYKPPNADWVEAEMGSDGRLVPRKSGLINQG